MCRKFQVNLHNIDMMWDKKINLDASAKHNVKIDIFPNWPRFEFSNYEKIQNLH